MAATRIPALVALWTVAVLTTQLRTAGPSFIPDATSNTSTLAGWHVLGPATWRVDNGELVGNPKESAGGWLVMDRSLQDVALFASFKCAQGCETGVLLRAEKTSGGMKGIYVSLTGGEVASYRATLDQHGRILTRTRCGPAADKCASLHHPPRTLRRRVGQVAGWSCRSQCDPARDAA